MIRPPTSSIAIPRLTCGHSCDRTAAALLHTGNTPSKGPYHENLQRAVAFILHSVEQSPAEGLEVTNLRGTQIQRKLAPYIDTFLSAKLLRELDGGKGNAQSNARVRRDLEKCVAKIEKNQLNDGSWNIAGAWAPIFGTSLASQRGVLFLSEHQRQPPSRGRSRVGEVERRHEG
jgi:hypothetical protein